MGKNENCKCELYNGWTNYLTWAANLGLNNDENTYLYMREEAERIKANPEFIEIKDCEKILIAPRVRMGDFIKAFLDENNPLLEENNNKHYKMGIYADFLNYSLAHINYFEIADHYLED